MAEEQVEFKYRADYAKSDRSSCKACKTKIEKSVLRLAVLVQSSHFDGKVPHWYHVACFFGKQKPTDSADIEHFESLKWDDQEKVKAKIAERMGNPVPEKTKGKSASKRPKKSSKPTSLDTNVKDYVVEYAKSSRAMCRGCEIKIAKDEVRISKKDYESEDAKRYGGKDLWHHVECFCKLRVDLLFFESADMLPGFKTLSKEDQITLKNSLPKIAPPVKDEVDGEPGNKKAKHQDPPKDTANVELMKKQNNLIHKYRDILKSFKRPELLNLLAHNKQADHFKSQDERIDHLAEGMAFGALKSCEVCKDGQFIFKSGIGYECRGNLTEWTKCLRIEKVPKRVPFEVPESLIACYPELEKYKCVIDERKIVFSNRPSTSVKMETDEVDSGPKVERFAPLKNLLFFIIGRTKQKKDDLKKRIVKLGGTLSNTFNIENLTAIISNEAEVEACENKMLLAKNANIYIIPESFVDECVKGGDMSELISKMSIAPWGTNIKSRILVAKLNAASKSLKSKSIFTKSGPSKVTLKVKEGLAVDPDSGLEDVASVYVDKKLGPYSITLARTSIQKHENSFYKMQLLVHDHSSVLKKKYYLFRSWGRIGTSIGSNKLDKFDSLDTAKEDFHSFYLEKTQNEYKDKDKFKKKSGGYCPVEVDYGESNDLQLSMKSEVPSKLHDSVQQLVTLLFDVEIMKSAMMEFELDLEKMPLGKLSKKQILKAFGVLSELQKKDGDIKPNVVIDATNRFYTLIPHSFGINNPPKLDNKEIIQSKVEMLESLLEMETAYSLLKDSGGEGDDDVHPIDKHYSKLNSNIEVLEKESEEYAILNTYLNNTHAATHTTYKLEIMDVFQVKRQGEEKRYKPFKKLHNRKLLWHGSRLTNFAGILSQGLRIAPPEAPVTGYMFGKGIYFADMVSKSANYCMTSRQNNVGLLLLCEVALGDMYERTHADYIEKLPKGKHSAKGVGSTSPNPDDIVKLDDGVEIPTGKGMKAMEFNETSLLYNEYIVYDPAQVKTRYLLKVKFNYTY